jgi:hypothetical protein
VDAIDTLPDPSAYYPQLGNLFKSNARAIGILVVLNDLRSTAVAKVDHAAVMAGSLVVRSDETAQLLAELTTTVTASGGSFYGTGKVLAVNGQLATNLVLADATATVQDSAVTTTGGVEVIARNRAGIDATALAATASGDTAVGVTIAFNSIGWASQNVLFNAIDALIGFDALGSAQPSKTHATVAGSTIAAGGGLKLDAIGAAQLNATVSNAAESAASALFKATGKAVGVLLASNKVATDTAALLTTSTATAGSALTVTAEDAAGVYANIKIVSASATANDGGTAVLQTQITTQIPVAGKASDGQRFTSSARTSASTWRTWGSLGSVVTYMGVDGTIDLKTQEYADRLLWRVKRASQVVPQGLNFTESDSMAIGAAVVLNDVRATAAAAIRAMAAPVRAGSVTVAVIEDATISALADVSGRSSGGSSFTATGCPWPPVASSRRTGSSARPTR